MKQRSGVAAFINAQIAGYSPEEGSDKAHHHYGREELRALLDYIYQSEPQSDDEKINGGPWGY